MLMPDISVTLEMSLSSTIFSWPVAAQVLVLLATWILGAWLLSPLQRIPGPTLASFSRLWHIIYIVRGDQNTTLADLHDKHGQSYNWPTGVV